MISDQELRFVKELDALARNMIEARVCDDAEQTDNQMVHVMESPPEVIEMIMRRVLAYASVQFDDLDEWREFLAQYDAAYGSFVDQCQGYWAGLN